jgi:predicted Zn-dependent protease
MEGNKVYSSTLADIYLQQGYAEKAIEIYKELVKREPGNALYRKRLMILKKEMKEHGRRLPLSDIIKKQLW